MMKKLIAIALFILCAISLFAESYDVIWLWGKNDSDVNYFRYSSDEENWTVVRDEQRDAVFSVLDGDSCPFYIQQSYDSIHWSKSSFLEYQTPGAIEAQNVKSAKQFQSSNGFVITGYVSPYSTLVINNSNFDRIPGRPDGRNINSRYAASLGLNTAYFTNSGFGFGLDVVGTYALTSVSTVKNIIHGDVHAFAAYQMIAHPTYIVSAKAGAGVQLQVQDDEFFISPSVMASIDVSINLAEHWSLSIAPTASFAFGVIPGASAYTAYSLRGFSVGAEYRL